MAASEVRQRCTICRKYLDIIGYPLSENCGGTCLGCMADAGDPECKEALVTLVAQEMKAQMEKTPFSDAPYTEEYDDEVRRTLAKSILSTLGIGYWHPGE